MIIIILQRLRFGQSSLDMDICVLLNLFAEKKLAYECDTEVVQDFGLQLRFRFVININTCTFWGF